MTGTSPLYLWPSVFNNAPSEEDVIGALSLVIWTLTLVMVIKYVVGLASSQLNWYSMHVLSLQTCFVS